MHFLNLNSIIFKMKIFFTTSGGTCHGSGPFDFSTPSAPERYFIGRVYSWRKFIEWTMVYDSHCHRSRRVPYINCFHAPVSLSKEEKPVERTSTFEWWDVLTLCEFLTTKKLLRSSHFSQHFFSRNQYLECFGIFLISIWTNDSSGHW